MIQQEKDDGLKLYKKNVAAKIKNRGRLEWLASRSQFIDNVEAESDFIYRCYFHWAELLQSEN